MTEFNLYNLYSITSNQIASEDKDNEMQEYIRTINAFINFHRPSTLEERQKFVNDALQGRNYNQTLSYEDETMDFEFTEDFVRVTLHSPDEGRNNRYFQYSTK